MDLLQDTSFTNSNPISTPIDPNHYLIRDKEVKKWMKNLMGDKLGD